MEVSQPCASLMSRCLSSQTNQLFAGPDGCCLILRFMTESLHDLMYHNLRKYRQTMVV